VLVVRAAFGFLSRVTKGCRMKWGMQHSGHRWFSYTGANSVMAYKFDAQQEELSRYAAHGAAACCLLLCCCYAQKRQEEHQNLTHTLESAKPATPPLRLITAAAAAAAVS